VCIGRGWVRIRHGTVPVPAPATQALIEGMPVYGGEIDGEWLTPTGAALLQEIVTRWGPLPPMRIERIGSGAGRDDPERANVLRLFLGESQSVRSDETENPFGGEPGVERLTMLETSIDDMNPQLYPYVTARLLDEGALEVAALPAVMKKGRPGHVLRVLARPEQAQVLARILLVETTTLGVRAYNVVRLAASRRILQVETEFGIVPVKIAVNGATVVNAAPEFEACRALAERLGVPVKRVIAAAQRAAGEPHVLHEGSPAQSADGTPGAYECV
jgi:uncharacterized protein (TIGR00299 family) protein